MTVDEMIRALETARDAVGGDALVCAERSAWHREEPAKSPMTVDDVCVDDGVVWIEVTDY